MTDQAQSPSRYDLVGLYADRVQSRYQRPSSLGNQRRTTEGVQTFGRRPSVRQLSSSRRRRAVSALMATAMFAGSAPALASSSAYEIQPGDTLSELAERYGVTVQELVQLNDIANPDLIYAGDYLSLGGAISAKGSPASTATEVEVGDTVYEIKEGDTLFEIAYEFGVDLNGLLALNNISNANLIVAGETLILPTRGQTDVSSIDNWTPGPLAPESDEHGSIDTEPAQVGDTVYEIKEGDTLFEVAYAFEVDLNELMALNNIPNANLIEAGDVLILPTRAQTDSSTVENEIVGQGETDNGHPAADDNIIALHLVASGETLGAIALRYGISVERLATVNGIQDYTQLRAGTMLSIPGEPLPDSVEVIDEAPGVQQEAGAGTILSGVPALQQSLALSCESAALSMVTAYWGYQVSEWVFIENMPYHPNPHHGFRGDMTAAFGGTDNYGVYARPLSAMLSNYGFVGDEFYTNGDPTELKARLDSGQPVIVWMTNMASTQERSYGWHDGERFALVPQQHVVVVYGYDDAGVHVADPGDGQHRTFGWDDFVRSWSYFDGMSLAVYPKS